MAGIQIQGALPTSAQSVVISEFMAANSHSLADEDGDASDWLELHNMGEGGVNLDGWFLTDDPKALTKWRLPATNLVGNGFMVVFASGKDRRIPGAPLHTNFKLSAGGEFLALIQPDGAKVAFSYAPAFPPQVPDVSYGLDPGLRQTNFLGPNSLCQFLAPGAAGLATNWVQNAYDDSTWRRATSAVGYASSAIDVIPIPGLTDQLVGYWKLDEASGSTAADASGQATNGILANFPADGSGHVAGQVGRALHFRGDKFLDQVRIANYPKATNALTVAAWVWADGRPTWASIAKNWGSSGLGQFHFGLHETAGDLDVFLRTSGGEFNVREGKIFPTGQWVHVAFIADAGTLRLFRNGELVAAGAYAGNLVSPAVKSLGLGAKLNDSGTASDPSAPGFWQGRLDEVAIWNRALDTNEIRSFYSAAGPSGFIKTDVYDAMHGLSASCYLRSKFQVADPTVYTRWRLQLRYNDGFVAWLNGEEIARRNAPDILTGDAAATGLNPDGEAFVEFNLNAFETLFRPGANLLAIQGLNRDKNDADFFLQPVIQASSLVNTTNALVYFTIPTPGAENTVGSGQLGPILSEAGHVPATPGEDEDLNVTVRLTPALAAVTNVALRYRVMFGEEVPVPMVDDGLHGDGAAGDGVYGATIPSSAYAPGQMVRYFIRALDATGASSRWPVFDDPSNADEYLGTVVKNSAITTALPTMQWFLQNPPQAETDAGTRCSIFYAGEFYDNIYVRIRGGTSRGWPKKSYKMELNDTHHFLPQTGQARVREFDLNTTYTDKSYVRAVMAYEHQRDAGQPSPQSFFLQLRQNGAFYSLTYYVEQPDADFLRRNGLDPRGALYKGGPGSSVEIVSSFEKKTRPFEGNSDLQELVTATGLRGTALESYVFDNLDLPGMINFLATVAITQNIDASDKNFFLYRDTEGSREWRMLPWDLDLTFGPDALNTDNIVASQQNAVAPAAASHPFIGARPYLLQGGKYNRLIEAVVGVPRTRAMLLRRIRTLTDRFLLTPYFTNRMEQLYTLLAPDVAADVARWGSSANFPPANSYTFRQSLDRIKKEYLIPRVPYLIGTNILDVGASNPSRQAPTVLVDFGGVEFDPSSGRQSEEYVQVTNANAFAVDISDWQLAGAVRHSFKRGTVIPAHDELFVSPDLVAFRARLNGPRGGQGRFVQGNYSGQLSARGESVQLLDDHERLVATLSYPGAPSPAQLYLRVTEVMYHPAPFPGGTNDPEEYEFIELMNISPTVTLDLTGVHFANGIAFTFSGSASKTLAPGKRMLVVRNRIAFAARYGAGIPVAGQYTGSLENNGEAIRLDDAAGEMILNFAYDNSWYPITDGFGFSLVIADVNAPWNSWGDRAAWRPGTRLQGTPDAGEVPASWAPVVINEVLSHSESAATNDYVELYNSSDHAVDISGWYLTDDFRTPKKYRIPAETNLPAGGYRVFTEHEFNSSPGIPPSFAFSGQGDEVFLFSGDASGDLTGYVHGFRFGAAPDGVSFGRYLTRQGEEVFVAQIARTPGATNAGPRVSPMVISEIFYHPPDSAGGEDNSLDEFIEIQNTSSLPVALFDQTFPSNVWRIRGGIEFDFPSHTTVNAGGFVIVVRFDPSTNGAALTAFQSRYPQAGNLQIFGPLRGKLDNSADSVRLESPDRPVPVTGQIPYIEVDAVDYADGGDWPVAADGWGASLQRRSGVEYANDSENWIAAAPTPGQGIGTGSAPQILVQPSDQVALLFQVATLRVNAQGASPLRYQWMFEGSPLLFGTNAELTIANLQLENDGRYQVAVFNTAGAVTSSVARLSIHLPLLIAQSPTNLNVLLSSNATLSVTAFGEALLTYAWRFNGTPIPGATNRTLVLTNAQLAQSGLYSVVVADSAGPVLSSPAVVNVVIRPQIVQPPLGLSVPQGGTVTLSVSVSNTATFPIGYRWRRNGSTYAFYALNERQSFLTVTNVQVNATFTVVVTNAALPNGVLSSAAVLTVLPDTDHDGIPDAVELANGLNPNDPSDGAADADGDGMTNAQEYLVGTDMLDPSSYLKIERVTMKDTIEFVAVSNRTYTVQFRDPSLDAPWSKLTDVLATATNRLENVTDAATNRSRIYRLVVPRQP